MSARSFRPANVADLYLGKRMNLHPHSDDHYNLNHLTRGITYRATTATGTAVGEYLGMESAHGDRAILLRHRTGTASISVCDLTSVRPAA